MPSSLVVALIVSSLGSGVGEADAAPNPLFQYSLSVPSMRGPTRAFLWLPHEAEQIRGLVVAGMTLAERELVQDPRIRAACRAESLGIVFLRSGLAAVDLPDLLQAFSKASGYRELEVAPLFFVGHSAGGPQAKAAAARFAERCFGIVQYRGGAPSWDPPLPAGIPALMMLGQFDEFGKAPMRDAAGRENWENGRDEMAAYRALGPDRLGSIVIEPGAGHFAWSDRSAAYLALFLRKAARSRIPAWSISVREPVRCRPIDPASGWLADLTFKTPGQHPPAPAAKYAGDPARAGWHFDQEMVEATLAHHRGLGKKDQFLTWRDPHRVEAGARFFFESIRWVDDGRTFEVQPAYAKTYPRQFGGKGPRWPLAGEPVGHASVPIRVRKVGGPFVAVGDHRLRMRFDALAPAGEAGRGTFLAFSEGDRVYRTTEQVGMMPKGFANLTIGKEQKIAFPPIAALRMGDAPVPLRATSDAGLPVEYYVAHGPAVIADGILRIAEVPRRARFPIAIKVVAYQFGRGVEPKVRTAVPVERMVSLEK